MLFVGIRWWGGSGLWHSHPWGDVDEGGMVVNKQGRHWVDHVMAPSVGGFE